MKIVLDYWKKLKHIFIQEKYFLLDLLLIAFNFIAV